MFSDAEARALIGGESVVAFVARHSLTEGDEVPVTSDRIADPSSLKPAYARWSGRFLPEGDWTAVVEAVHPAAMLDRTSGGSRHIFVEPGEGDLVILRVFSGRMPVLSDEAYDARVSSIDGSLIR